MNIVDDRDGRLRIGCVLDAKAARREVGAADDDGNIDGYCVAAWAPSPLIAAMKAPGASFQQRLDVLVAPDSGEQFVLFAAQVGGAQIRVGMSLGEQDVRLYLLDCMQRGRLRLLLANETSKRRTFMDIGGGFRTPELLQLVRELQSETGDAQMLLKLGRRLGPLNGVRSLITGQVVTNAITVLVSSSDPVTALRAGPTFFTRDRTPLH